MLNEPFCIIVHSKINRMRKITYIIIGLSLTISVDAQMQTQPEPAFEFLTKYPNVRDFALSQNQQEAYFTIQSPFEELGAIACMMLVDGKWSAPVLVNFTGKYRDIEPFLSADGLRLYFSSNRPLSDNDSATSPKDYDIWYVERANLTTNWSPPINLGQPVNTAFDEFYPSLSKNKNLYFTAVGPNSTGEDDIYFSKWDGKKYSIPAPLGTSINTEGYEFNAYISPDEKFLLYTIYGAKDGLGSGDLYVSVMDRKGNWEKAVHLGKEINSKYMDYCPFVDITNGVLYFTSKRSNIENRYYTSIDDFSKEIMRYDNGFSRIYKVSIKEMIAKMN